MIRRQLRIRHRAAMTALKLGLIGNGAIARQIAGYCANHKQRFEIVGALALSGELESVGDHPLMRNLRDLTDLAPSLIIECAGHAAVMQHGAQILDGGIDLILVSIGSLCDENLLADLRRAELIGNSRLIFVAGALPGVDTLSIAALSGLQDVVLRSSKPPKAWRGTVAEANYDFENMQSRTVIFEGTAREAARLFPKNANIAATAALAGIGFERTRVILIADPHLSRNVHRLEARGAFGEMWMEVKANPSPDNPKTSLIAGLSVVKILEQEAAIRQKRPDGIGSAVAEDASIVGRRIVP